MHGLVKMMLTISCTTASADHYLYRLLRLCLCNHCRECLINVDLILHHDVKMNYEKEVYKTSCTTSNVYVVNCKMSVLIFHAVQEKNAGSGLK